MSDLPPPPVPIDADLRHFPNMPLEVGRLRDSELAGVADAEVFRCAVLLWGAAWHQIPAGSLPDDDATLARLAGLGRDLRTWKRLRLGALRGFHPFNDGRLYHRTVCEKAIHSLNSTRNREWYLACGRVRKENVHRKKTGKPLLIRPDRPAALSFAWPAPVRVPEQLPGSLVPVPERGFSPERKGREKLPRGAVDSTPLGTVTGTPSLAAERPRADGAAHDGSGEVVNLIARVAAAKTVPA